MSEPVQNTAVVAEGLGLLTSMYAKQPNVRKILTAILSVRQELENVMWGVFVGRRLRTATLYPLPQTNNVLDVIGALVGQPRGGISDAFYQAILFLRVAVNRSTGRITEWSNFASILLQTSGGGVEYFEGKTSFELGVFDMTLPAVAVASVLTLAVPNGVRAVFDYSTWPTGNDFRWAAADGTHGQGVWGDTAGTVGGLLVAALEMT